MAYKNLPMNVDIRFEVALLNALGELVIFQNAFS
jgi:hypothetical protein